MAEPKLSADMSELVVSARIHEVFFVIERGNGSWSPGAKILHVCETEEAAETLAEEMATDYPHRFFGVAGLRSECHHLVKPVQIVRVQE